MDCLVVRINREEFALLHRLGVETLLPAITIVLSNKSDIVEVSLAHISGVATNGLDLVQCYGLTDAFQEHQIRVVELRCYSLLH